MADSTLWWLLAGAAVAVELLTGTFYLLMLAVGMAAGALAAHAGGGSSTQLISAAVVGGGAVAAWHLVRRGRQDAALAPGADPAQNPDLGETVPAAAWRPDDTAVVRYRGTHWTAVPSGGIPQGPGAYRVAEVDGTRLVLEKI